MKFTETETKKRFLAVLGLLGILSIPLSNLQATDFSSGNYSVKDPVVTPGVGQSSSSNFGLGQSVGQTAIGKSTSASYQLWSGFQYFFAAIANTLTATAANGQVSLSWTVPTTYLGVAVGNYDLGVGTVSGSYTFETLGNVTSYTKTGLANGTTYYFIVRAETSGGAFIVYSNEASATPTGTGGSSGPVGGGGGGPPSLSAKIIISGTTFPGGLVTVLKDSISAATITAANDGNFTVTLEGLSSGIYNFGVYAVDPLGTKSATTAFSRDLASGVTVEVKNLLLAPTLHSSFQQIQSGMILPVSGFSTPHSAINLFLDGKTFLTVNATAQGTWQAEIATIGLNLGEHNLTASSSLSGRTSILSDSLSFLVGKVNVPTPDEPCPILADLNCDGRVDLVDFSIMLYYWERPIAGQIRADINRDGLVNLVDFSILLAYWTG